MPRELITIQVGQCGNQIAMRFWDLALQEHARYNKSGIYDDALSSFFRNVDTRYSEPLDIPVGRPISNLRARSVVIDMEEGVINNMLKSDLGELFDSRQIISDVSGAGDTVIAIATLCLAMKTSIEFLAALSNLSGGLVCEKVGVVSVNKKQLLAEAVSLFEKTKNAEREAYH